MITSLNYFRSITVCNAADEITSHRIKNITLQQMINAKTDSKIFSLSFTAIIFHVGHLLRHCVKFLLNETYRKDFREAFKPISATQPNVQKTAKAVSAAATINSEDSAAYMYKKKEDSQDKVIEWYLKLLTIDPNKAEEFILSRDSDGNNFLHLYFTKAGNPQKEFIKNMVNSIDKKIFDELLRTKNNIEQNPVSISIEQGQMELISCIFPIIFDTPSKDETLVSYGDIYVIISKLSNIYSHKKLMSVIKCDTNEYDKMNHIFDALHRLVLHGYGNDIINVIELIQRQDKVSGESNSRIFPLELTELLSFVNGYQWQDAYNRLKDECLALTTSEEIKEKIDEYALKAKDPIMYWSTMLNEDRVNPLRNLIRQALKSSDIQSINTYNNFLFQLLNPCGAYDQKIDLSSTSNSKILLFLATLVIKDEQIDMENAKNILKMLILKHPGFLKDEDEIHLYLNENNSNPRAIEFEKAIEDISNTLGQTLFENRIKRSLKYYLDHKGLELEQVEASTKKN